MIGQSTTQDRWTEPRDARPPALYRRIMSVPYSLMPMNLRAANKPSETNVVNYWPVVVQAQLPVQIQSPFTHRLLSRFTFLPVGSDKQATFGNT